ncbi:MAG: 1,4-dihydroxy-2-naphthoate octaprenyltransferase [Planctomycetota bacterium]
MTTTPNSMKAWIQVCRPFSYTATVIPVGLGAALAMFQPLPVRWWLFPLILLASLLIHAGTNLVNEYFDYKKGVDRPGTYGSSRALVDHLVSPEPVFLVGMGCFSLAACIGFVFILIHGWPILVLGVVGMLGGFFYTATPLAYKYLGLGDIFVFILMGPLMVIGSFYVLTGTYDHRVLLVSLPVGCLVAAILSGNNLRDITHDTAAGIRTTATILGFRLARYEYTALVAGAYVAVLAMVASQILPLWSLLTLLTVPLAIKIMKAALQTKRDQPQAIAAIDVQTAQTHLLFGVLLIVSVILGGLL